jgi:hypothetical protein
MHLTAGQQRDEHRIDLGAASSMISAMLCASRRTSRAAFRVLISSQERRPGGCVPLGRSACVIDVRHFADKIDSVNLGAM